MKLGCSYFGNRMPRHVRADMRELADMGCTYVVHTFNENDWMYYHDTMGEIVEITHEMGMEAHVDPWGVGKVFGGESFSNFVMQNADAMQMVSDGKPVGCACPNNEKFIQFMQDWTDAALKIGADVLFWDEPHFYLAGWAGGRPDTWGCRCQSCQALFETQFGKPMPLTETDEVRAFKEQSIMKFLTTLVDYTHKHGKRNSLCVLPLRDESHSTANWERFAAIPNLDSFGTDPYWYFFNKDLNDFVGMTCDLISEVTTAHGLDSHMWLQGYKVPGGREEEMVDAVKLMVEKGVKDIAVWGFGSCEHISYIRPDNPEKAWATVKKAFAWARDNG